MSTSKARGKRLGPWFSQGPTRGMRSNEEGDEGFSSRYATRRGAPKAMAEPVSSPMAAKSRARYGSCNRLETAEAPRETLLAPFSEMSSQHTSDLPQNRTLLRYMGKIRPSFRYT